jgi:hypothetical protein
MNSSELLPIYNETLYSIPSKSIAITKKIGNFGRKVLAVVNATDWDPQNEIFLEKILGSCNLSPNDYLILVIAKEANVFEIINLNLPDCLFLFDIQLDSDFFKSGKPLYKPFTMNRIKIVLSDSLQELSASKEKRLLLWNEAIKPLFKI